MQTPPKLVELQSPPNESADLTQFGSAHDYCYMIKAALPDHLACRQCLRNCGERFTTRFSLACVNHFRRLIFRRWSHETGFWWSCAYNPDIYFIIDPENDCRSICGHWERYMVEDTQELCWVHGEAEFWFLENEFLNDRGAEEPILVDKDKPTTASTQMIILHTEQTGAAEPNCHANEYSERQFETALETVLSGEVFRLRIMVFADQLHLRQANHVMCTWENSSRMEWQAHHFRNEAAQLKQFIKNSQTIALMSRKIGDIRCSPQDIDFERCVVRYKGACSDFCTVKRN